MKKNSLKFIEILILVLFVISPVIFCAQPPGGKGRGVWGGFGSSSMQSPQIPIWKRSFLILTWQV